MSVWADNPQAVQIDALIGRAGRLALVECDRLTTAGFVAGAQDAVAAWFADRDAVRGAARDAAAAAAGFAAAAAAGFAARGAAGFAARGAARGAVGAAVALVVRDLIDEATAWNQAAYDCLTGPWRRVIGPVHPDDEVLR